MYLSCALPSPRVLFLFFLSASLFLGSFGPSQADVTRPSKKLSLKDGSVWVGELASLTETTVVLRTNGKEMVFARENILRMEDLLPAAEHRGTTAGLKLAGAVSNPKGEAPKETRETGETREARDLKPRNLAQVPGSDSTRGLRFREVEVNPRQGWLIAGITMLSIAYGISLIASSIFLATSSTNNTALICGYSLMVPIGGPFVAFGASFSDQSFRAGTPWFLLLGLVQAAGLTFLIIGLTAKPVKVREYFSASEPERPRFAILPYATPDGGGLTAFGTF